MRDTVLDATGGRQEPFVYGSLSSAAIYLKPGAGGDAPATAQPEFDPRSVEVTFWSSIVDSNSKALFDEYLRRYPTGEFSFIAKTKLATLNKSEELEPPQREEPDPEQIATDLQRALKAAECYTGRIDGIWGRGSRTALQRFAKAAKAERRYASASKQALEMVRSKRGVACVVVKGEDRNEKEKKKSKKKTSNARMYNLCKNRLNPCTMRCVYQYEGQAGGNNLINCYKRCGAYKRLAACLKKYGP